MKASEAEGQAGQTESGARVSRRSPSARRASRTAAYREKIQEALGMPRPGHVVAEKYRIDEMLGMGGMGAVFAATHLLTGKRVALKWLLPGADEVAGAEERLLREAKATARIDHPNVVNVFDVGRHASGLFLVMELLRGESLSERLSGGPMTSGQAIAVLLPALHGVAAAHAEGVIHRDLKPDNIFVCTEPDGTFRESKVLDFGISKFSGSEDVSLTVTGALLGTPCYMAPEQVRGAKTIDLRADIYAIGVILYELLTDAYPFDADSFGTLIFKIVMDEPRPLQELAADVDPQLVAIVARAMAKQPADRYPDVPSLIAALSPFADPEPASRRSSTPERASRPHGSSTPPQVQDLVHAATQPSQPPAPPELRDSDSQVVRTSRPEVIGGATLMGGPGLADSAAGTRPAQTKGMPGRRGLLGIAALLLLLAVVAYGLWGAPASPESTSDADLAEVSGSVPAPPPPADKGDLPGPAATATEPAPPPTADELPEPTQARATRDSRESAERRARRRAREAARRLSAVRAAEAPASSPSPAPASPATAPPAPAQEPATAALPDDWDSRIQPVEMRPRAPVNPAGRLSADDL